MVDGAAEALAKWLNLSEPSLLQRELAEQDIVAVERRYGMRIPDDLRAFLPLSSSADDGVWDDELVLWWSIRRLKNIPDEYEYLIRHPDIVREAGAYLFFADYSIWCWAWAVCCSDGPNRGRVAIIGAGDEFVADSFGDFVNLYLRDRTSVMR